MLSKVRMTENYKEFSVRSIEILFFVLQLLTGIEKPSEFFIFIPLNHDTEIVCIKVIKRYLSISRK